MSMADGAVKEGFPVRLNLTILRLNKHRFFNIRLYHKIRNIELTQ
jgi:hypothetical protein